MAGRRDPGGCRSARRRRCPDGAAPVRVEGRLIQAAGENLYRQIVDQRGQAPVGDVAGAVANLMDHYEETGDLTIRTLAQEGQHEVLRALAEPGRAVRSTWVATTFGPFLEGRTTAAREDRLTKLVVATDLYVWKLLRRDLGLGREQAERYITEMVSAVSVRGE